MASAPSFRSAFVRGAGHAGCAAIGLTLIEVLHLPGSGGVLRVIERSLACVGYASLLALIAVPLFALLYALARASTPLGTSEPPSGGLLERAVGEGAEGSARVVSVLVTLVLFGAGVIAIAHWAISSMQQTIFMALGIGALSLVLVLVLALLHLSLHGAIRRLFCVARKLPALFRQLERPALVLAALITIGLLALIAVSIAQREITQHLPWGVFGKLLFALGFALACAWVRLPEAFRPRARLLHRLGAGLALGLSAIAIITLVRLDPKRTDSAQRVQARSLLGTAGHALLLALFDRDRDRHLHFAGGGDCRPLDRKVHPGAIDRLDDGIDGDCDGEDARKVRFARGVYDYPVPSIVPKPQQIFLITIDALQYHKLFARYDGKPYLPNLEKLANESVVFEAAFSAGSATDAAFPPMFTSRWDSQIEREPGGKSPHGIAKSELMLAELLRDKKYRTLAVLPNVYFFPSMWKGLTSGFQDRIELPNTSRFKGGIRNADQVADRAIEALAKRDPSERLFAWIHFFDAHAPYHLIKLPGIGPFPDEPEGRYDSEIQYIDQQAGRLIQAIKERGYSEPLIIVTADHGTSFDTERHERPYGLDLYSDIVRVPLFVWGRAFAPRRDRSLVSTIDLAPTLINLIGTGRKLAYEGVSLVPQLVGRKPVERTLHHQLWAQERIVKGEGDPLTWASLRDDRYHLVHDRDHDRVELYDWRSDPFEQQDLLRNPKHAQAARRLRSTLSRLLAEIYPQSQADQADQAD